MINQYRYLFLSQEDLRKAIAKTPCKKWQAWFKNHEVSYPCVCPYRDENCIKLEFNYELQKVAQFRKQESLFKQAVDDYSLCNNERDRIIAWVEKYAALGSRLLFSPTISILNNPQNNTTITIELNPDEFNTIIQFQEIFNSVYYSEEFQTNKSLIKVQL